MIYRINGYLFVTKLNVLSILIEFYTKELISEISANPAVIVIRTYPLMTAAWKCFFFYFANVFINQCVFKCVLKI